MGATLALDIGGTKVARSGAAGGVLLWPADGTLAADLAALDGWLADVGAVDGVGVSAAPDLDDDGVVRGWPNRPWWRGVDLVGRLGERLGAPVVTADDGVAAAQAEAAATGRTDLVFVGVGTGIAGGVVRDGEPMGAALGHLPIAARPVPCRCGRNGCVQAMASGPAVLAHAAERRGAPVDGPGLVAGLDRGEPWARGPIEEAARDLGRLCVVVHELFGIDRIAVGGGVATAIDGLVPLVVDAVAALGRDGRPDPVVVPAILGAEASLRGAEALAARAAAFTASTRGGRSPR